jgi:hypothetical protein
MIRLRKRFTPKDVFVLRYEIREYILRENSYKRFLKPIFYEFDHRIKIGAGYTSSPKVFPYFFYEYMRSLNDSENHSGIFGVRIHPGLATMIEPTYSLMNNNGNIFHSIIMRLQQIITPRTYFMLKNSFIFPNFASVEKEITWINQFEPYLAHRITAKNALHIGYRQFNSFSGTKTYTIWSQFAQQFAQNYTFWIRFRRYVKPPNTIEEIKYNSMSFELKVVKKSLSEKGNLKNLVISGYNIFLKNNKNIWANVTGIEVNYLIPK